MTLHDSSSQMQSHWTFAPINGLIHYKPMYQGLLDIIDSNPVEASFTIDHIDIVPNPITTHRYMMSLFPPQCDFITTYFTECGYKRWQ